MSKRVIKVTLSEKSIDNAIKELKNYKTWLKECTEKFIQALGEEGVQVATAKFQTAVYDGTNDVSVSVESRDTNKVAVVAVGSSVLFIEFGTGVKYPDNHPEAGKNGSPVAATVINWDGLKRDGDTRVTLVLTVKLLPRENTQVKFIPTVTLQT